MEGALERSETLQHMKLKDAYLCMECDEVFAVTGRTNPSCPSCTGRSFAPLAEWVQTKKHFEKQQQKKQRRRALPAVRPYVLPALVADNDLADKVRTNVGCLGVDTSAELSEQSGERCAESVSDRCK